MSRFVILRHESPNDVHFDLMFEVGDVLKTWALPQPPQTSIKMKCDALGDHRVAYLDYEGPISGDRGSVTRWDRGTYTIERQTDTEWAVNLAGEKLAGKATLQRLPNNPNIWTISFRVATS